MMTSKTCLVLFLSFALLTVVGCAPDEAAEKAKLEQQFVAEYEQIASEKKRLALALQEKIKTRAAGKKNVKLAEIVPANDEDLVALNDAKKRQTEVLQKLVKNNPNDTSHRFRLALSHFEQNDAEPGLKILQKISPLATPGHPGGHLLLAKYFVTRSAKASQEAVTVSMEDETLEASSTDTRKAVIANIKNAMTHIDHCLTQDEDNVEALKFKATLHNKLGQFAAAYDVLERLFKNDPKYYSILCQINNRLKRPEKNVAVAESAIERFESLLNRTEPLSDQQRVAVWQELTKCYLVKKDFGTIEARLLEAFKPDPADTSETAKAVQTVGKRLLAGVYSVWAKEFPLDAESSAQTKLELLRKAYQLESKDLGILRELAVLGGNENEVIASEARSIYDARNDVSAPAAVLFVLGSQDLLRDDYNSAIIYLERAFALAPRNAELLNNLAFAYLQGDAANAARSLQLADEAVRLTTGRPGFEKYETFFQDTRGQALMQLQRTQEAIVAFEVALKSRPENTKILEALIACYGQLGMPTSTWESKLLKARESSSGG